MMKVGLVMISCFILIMSVYWFLIRPFNVTRILFGMKPQFNSPLNRSKAMKTKEVKSERRNSRLAGAVMFSLMMLLLSASLSAQETKQERTLLGPDVTYITVWAPEVKLNSIQGKTGTLVGGYGGVLINRNYLLGFAGKVNLSHPTVNYGYFGGIAQVILYP